MPTFRLLARALLVLVALGSAGAAPVEAEEVVTVGYGEAVFHDSVVWFVVCSTDVPLPTYGVVVSFESETFDRQFGFGEGRRATAGRIVRVGSAEAVVEERVEDLGGDGFIAWQSISFLDWDGPVNLRVAWAAWAPAECGLTVDGTRRTWTQLPGDRARHLGPRDFEAGVMIQEQTLGVESQSHVVATTGKAMAYVAMSSIGAGGFLRPSRNGYICVFECAHSDSEAGPLLVSVPASVGSAGNGNHAWIIDVPLDVVSSA